MSAGIAVDPGKAVVWVAAGEEALKRLLFDRAPQRAGRPQLARVTARALPQRACARIARAVEAAGRPGGVGSRIASISRRLATRSQLGDLAAIDSASALSRRLRHYASFDLICIDEVGYLSYSNRHADLLFELTNRRYEKKSTLITTNRAFAEWQEVFPNAACVVSLIDRLTHNAEVIALEGESYRLKEAQERAEQRAQRRRRKTK